VPAHHRHPPREPLLLHQVADHALGLLRALFVPGVGEQPGAVAGDYDAAAEALAGRVIEVERLQPVSERETVLIGLEVDLDAPLVGLAGIGIAIGHRPNLIRRAREPGRSVRD
jgi:hypothetical protein